MFFFHWKEESQHAILDELEWRREDAQLTPGAARHARVDDLIALVAGDRRDAADAGRRRRDVLRGDRRPAVHRRPGAGVQDVTLRAYRWQYIVSGACEPRFAKILHELVSPEQAKRIDAALAPLLEPEREASVESPFPLRLARRITALVLGLLDRIVSLLLHSNESQRRAERHRGDVATMPAARPPVYHAPLRGRSAMAAIKQQIRFCTSHDGVRIAYASSGQGPPLVKVANWLSPPRVRLGEPGVAAAAAPSCRASTR